MISAGSMSTEEQTQAPTQAPTTQLPGDLLRAKREEKGLTQQDIATRLRLKLDTVQKLEANAVDDKQVATFVRGYYRNYAKLVGIPETEITQATNQILDAKVKQQPMTSFSKGSHRARHDRRISRLSWVIFIAVAGISAVWYWQSLQHDNQTEDELNTDSAEVTTLDEGASTETTDVETLPTPEASKAPILVEKEAISNMSNVNAAEAIAQEESAAPEAADASAATDGATADDAATDAQATATDTQDETAPVVADGNKVLTLAFSGDCWMQVKDKDGKVLVSGLKKSGDTLTISDSDSYNVTLGAPHVVKMTLDSEAVDLSKYSGRVARLTLP